MGKKTTATTMTTTATTTATTTTSKKSASSLLSMSLSASSLLHQVNVTPLEICRGCAMFYANQVDAVCKKDNEFMSTLKAFLMKMRNLCQAGIRLKIEGKVDHLS